MSPITQESLFDIEKFTLLTARRVNVLRSPKQYGSSEEDSMPYLQELGVKLISAPQAIQFQPNTNEAIHRWSPYVQGFSASFVQRTLERYRNEYKKPVILDPFAGSGTVLVQSKLNGLKSYGIELNPLLHFIARVKVTSWNISPDRLTAFAQQVTLHQADEVTETASAPHFLKSSTHFQPEVLRNLERLKYAIDSIHPVNLEETQIKDLLLLAFVSILIDCSNLKRSPCLGYCRSKVVENDAPLRLFSEKINQMAEDLRLCQQNHQESLSVESTVFLGNSNQQQLPEKCDLIITSPPYMNGMDYVMNYKIEMGWMGYSQSHRQLKQLKDQMVVCDNVSKGLIRDFENSDRYTHPWIEQIKTDISTSIKHRGNYRRHDMPEIVHKYFDDMYKVMRNITTLLSPGGRFILVVGDSLIADIYVPTDLILAQIGKHLGLSIEHLEKARERRSGQVRSYRLRESILTLRKE
jgi:SAM-dependent methyltransferase